MTSARNRVCYSILLGLFLFSLVSRAYLTWNRRFNADEFQHLHAAWMIHSGYLPYRDFWENHTPLFHYLIAPSYQLFDEIPLILIVRTIMSATALLIVWFTYLIARLDHDRLTSLLSAAVLSVSALFLQKTIEIRPDQFLVIFWLASLWISIRFFHVNKNSLHLITAGLLLGIGMLFTPKALLCFAAAAILFFTGSFSRILSTAPQIITGLITGTVQSDLERKFIRAFKYCILYTVGFIVPVGACALFFWQQNSLHLLVQSTLLENLDYPNLRHPTYLLSLQHIVLFLLALAGIVVCWQEHVTDRSKYQSRFLLVVPGLFLLFTFLFIMPAPFPQSALIFVPILAIFGGIASRKSLRSILDRQNPVLWKQKSFFAFTVLAGVLVPCGSLFVKQPTTASNAKQLDLVRHVLNRTSSQDVFFDGNSAYIFRPQAYYYGSLVEGVRDRIARGEIRSSISQSLRDHRCKFIIYDDRVSMLPTDIQQFIRSNFISTEFPQILVAGRELDAESFSGRRAKFWMQIPQSYSIQVAGSTQFTVDGKPYRSPVFLSTGFHELVADRELDHIILRAAP